MRISDWSSDVCSSDLPHGQPVETFGERNPLPSRPGIEYLLPRRKRLRTQGAHPHKLYPETGVDQIGRASCRERVRPCGELSLIAAPLKKKQVEQLRQP